MNEIRVDLDASQPPVCLLDASIYFFRYYFTLPDEWHSAEGWATSAVYGYTRFLLSFLEQVRPSLMGACFDESLGSCFRNHLYPDYKSSRPLPDEALVFQLQACKDVTALLGVDVQASTVYEADDLIGSWMQQLHVEHADQVVAVLTRDKDLGQLLRREQDFLWDYISLTSQTRTGRQQIFDKFGVWPEQLVDYLALVGDPVDDIPGVPGIGAKTAAGLLQWGESLQGILQRWAEIDSLPLRGAKKIPGLLSEHSGQLGVSRALAEIVIDIEEMPHWHALQRRPPNVDALRDFCQQMGLPAGFVRRAHELAQSFDEQS